MNTPRPDFLVPTPADLAAIDAVIGKVLDHFASDLNELATGWIRDGKDITQLVFVVLVGMEGGRLNGLSRAELNAHAETEPSLAAAAAEVEAGPRDKIPAVMMIEDWMLTRVVWIEPVSPAEVH